MSRIGKKPIIIPNGVVVEIKDNVVSVKGPKGALTRTFDPRINLQIDQNILMVTIKGTSKEEKSLWGTWRQHLNNMVEGVTKGFSKQLQIEGIGYRAVVEGSVLVLSVGFTHQNRIAADNVVFNVEKNIITVSGIDKDTIAKTAAQIRRIRPPEPYKGKGIRYVGEFVRRKVGKKAAAGATK